jgi:hypothetical protein
MGGCWKPTEIILISLLSIRVAIERMEAAQSPPTRMNTMQIGGDFMLNYFNLLVSREDIKNFFLLIISLKIISKS